MNTDTGAVPGTGSSPTTEPVPEVTRAQLLALVRAGARLVETLGAAYFADAHLPGALHLPHERVEELAPLLLPDARVVVVLYGSDPACHQCVPVARRLLRLGYADVRCYPGGKQDWLLAGLPVERGPLT